MENPHRLRHAERQGGSQAIELSARAPRPSTAAGLSDEARAVVAVADAAALFHAEHGGHGRPRWPSGGRGRRGQGRRIARSMRYIRAPINRKDKLAAATACQGWRRS